MDIKLGPRIASLRRAKSMTQEQLALSPVSYTHLSKLPVKLSLI